MAPPGPGPAPHKGLARAPIRLSIEPAGDGIRGS